jgi:cyclic pyranopterin phosphate synthase
MNSADSAQPFSHFDAGGASRMVDVGSKPLTARSARASACVALSAATLEHIWRRESGKGNVLEVARLAGIMAAKRTADLIPLCHVLPLDSVTVDFAEATDGRLRIEAIVHCIGRTGVEMEALMAASISALTVYDMCKAMDRGIRVEAIQLEEKSGGRSGHYLRGDGTGT